MSFLWSILCVYGASAHSTATHISITNDDISIEALADGNQLEILNNSDHSIRPHIESLDGGGESITRTLDLVPGGAWIVNIPTVGEWVISSGESKVNIIITNLIYSTAPTRQVARPDHNRIPLELYQRTAPSPSPTPPPTLWQSIWRWVTSHI